ncbi:MAG: peptidoglycan editing factor PgeF [Pseudomonadales bacterium]|jgi:YfiH family protein|nr:peptidoglycan editing factor PgeF [Pseudomonadales bacterium]
MSEFELPLLEPDWPLPAGVRAFVSTRAGGVSAPPYASLNLGQYVDDLPQAVAHNRALLLREVERRTGWRALRVQWIRQVHGIAVHEVQGSEMQGSEMQGKAGAPLPEADAIHCRVPGVAVAVLTADCLPVLFASDDGQEVAVAHAGWRGLLQGVLEATAARLRDPAATSAWLGPAIGPCHFEVGEEVRAAFLRAAAATETAATQAAFTPAPGSGKWYADLYALARLRLARAGLRRVYGKLRCTVCEAQLWYSYRGEKGRSEGRTGRFASLIVSSPCLKESL